jgi:outer membrane immunogenic protein
MRTMLGSAVLGSILGATLAAGAAGTACAADMAVPGYYTAPPSYGVFSWAGPYLGANLGYEWGAVSNNPTKPSGIFGGAQAGYNWQFGQFVTGIEGDFQGSAAQDTFAPWQFDNPWFGTLRGRVGFTMGNALIYGTGGLAYGSLTVQTPGNFTETRDSIGWTAGAGVELGLTPRWSAKAEWLYLDLADRSYSLTGTNNGLTANLLRLGVNYHF